MAASSIRTASSCASSEVDDIAVFGFGGIPSDNEMIMQELGKITANIRYAFMISMECHWSYY
jgi:hypothetical protein